MRTRERRCQSAPLVYAGQLETGQTPQSCRGRSRTYAVPAYMQIDTWFLSSDCVDPLARRSSLHRWSCPLTPKYAGGKLAAPRSCGLEGQASRLGESLKGAAVADPSRRAPSVSLGAAHDQACFKAIAGACWGKRAPVLPGTAAVESLSGRQTPSRRPRKSAG